MHNRPMHIEQTTGLATRTVFPLRFIADKFGDAVQAIGT